MMSCWNYLVASVPLCLQLLIKLVCSFLYQCCFMCTNIYQDQNVEVLFDPFRETFKIQTDIWTYKKGPILSSNAVVDAIF